MKKITTPICDFVRTYAESKKTRMHMPGHKGAGTLGIEALDITEISGADSLYESDGIIKESEENIENDKFYYRHYFWIFLILYYDWRNQKMNKVLKELDRAINYITWCNGKDFNYLLKILKGE